MNIKELPNLINAKQLCIDTETYDPNLKATGPSVRTGGYIAGIAVATDDQSWYFPIGHAQGQNYDREKVIAWCNDMFSTPCDKVFANALYDLDYLREAGVYVNGKIIDIQVAEPLIDEDAKSYSLDNLANKYLNTSKVDDELYEYCAMHFGGKATRSQAGNIWRCPPEIVEPYAKGDVELPLLIWDKQQTIIEQEGLSEVFDLESRLIPLLLEMRQRGVKVDLDLADEYVERYSKEIPEIQNRLNDLCGFELNPYAAASMQQAFEKLSLGYPRTDKGNASFTSDFLKSVAHPIAKDVIDIKHKKKMLDTFIQGYVKNYEVNGRVHCQFNQLKGDEYGTVTGRFSSSHPNLQNIPSAKDIRSLYIAEDGEDWYKLDYASVEYRIACHYGRGESAEIVRQMYKDDPSTDFHQVIADMVGIDRKFAKTINFGLLYGMGAQKLADSLNVSFIKAKELRAQYHRQAPFVQDLIQRASKVAETRGYVKTLSGRRRRFNLYEPAKWTRGLFPKTHQEALSEYGHNIKRAFTYKSLNSIVQGSSADVTKKAMVDIYESGVCDVLGVPLTTVHDELNFSVPRTKEGTEAINEVRNLMQNAYDLRVPLLVDVEKGTNWGDVEDIKNAD